MNWQYLAGYFDGEGWIIFYGENAIHLGVAQKSPAKVIYQVKDFLTEQGFIPNINLWNNGTTDMVTLLMRRTLENVIFLKMISPYLIEKKEKAILAIERLEQHIKTKGKMRPFRKLSEKLESATSQEVGFEYQNKRLLF